MSNTHLLRWCWGWHGHSRTKQRIKECKMRVEAQTCSAVEGAYRCLWPPGSGSACNGWMPGSAGPPSHPPSSGGNPSASSHHWTETQKNTDNERIHDSNLSSWDLRNRIKWLKTADRTQHDCDKKNSFLTLWAKWKSSRFCRGDIGATKRKRWHKQLHKSA